MSIQPDLSVCLCGVRFKNPIIAASGTFGPAAEYSKFVDLNGIGGISVKGMTIKPRIGNPPPRIAETPSGILNSVGLQNSGVDAFLKTELPKLRSFDTVIIANINGNTLEEYCQVADKLKGAPIDFIELNISCPNVKKGGAAFGAHPETVYEVTRAVRACCSVPLIVKLTPNTTDIRETAAAAEAAGCDALSLINTVLGMAIDIDTQKPVLGNVLGGLSGPAIKPIALRMVYEVTRRAKIPVIGMGGVMNAKDAVEFLLAGASAVAVGTAGLVTPSAWTDIASGLEEYMRTRGIQKIASLIGALKHDQ